MIVVAIRTDSPEAQIGLYDGNAWLAREIWHAHRELGRTIHSKLRDLLADGGIDWNDVEGVVAYKGPGSFTGLRIGLTVANSIAASLKIPIAGGSGEGWVDEAMGLLQAGKSVGFVLPEYGSEAHITQQRK